MRKTLYLWSAIVIIVLTLILAFENILYVQTYYILFYQVNASATVIILIAAILGFLVGFSAMLYSVEVSRQKKAAADADYAGVLSSAVDPEAPAPAATTEEAAPAASEAAPPEPEPQADDAKADQFDDDDEVLG